MVNMSKTSGDQLSPKRTWRRPSVGYMGMTEEVLATAPDSWLIAWSWHERAFTWLKENREDDPHALYLSTTALLKSVPPDDRAAFDAAIGRLQAENAARDTPTEPLDTDPFALLVNKGPFAGRALRMVKYARRANMELRFAELLDHKEPTPPPPDAPRWTWRLYHLVRDLHEIFRPADDATTQDKGGAAPSRRHELTSSSLSLTHLEIPSDPFMLIAGRAIYRPDLWSRSANGLPPMFIEGKTSIYVHPGNGIEALTPEQEESTWAQVRTLDDDHYRVLHVALAVCLAEHGGKYSAEKVRLHANRALELLGRKKHKGTYDPDDKLEMVHKIARLNTIWASGPQLIVENGKKKIVGTVSRLLEVAYEAHPALREEGPNYVVLIALGEWARPLLGPGMRQTALLLQDVLKIDPRDGKGLIASRLGLFLCQHWKIRASRGTYERPWPIKTLLDGAGIKIPEHREQRRRLRENFDEALDLLAKHGITPEWQYVVPEQATPTNAFTPWLAIFAQRTEKVKVRVGHRCRALRGTALPTRRLFGAQ